MKEYYAIAILKFQNLSAQIERERGKNIKIPLLI